MARADERALLAWLRETAEVRLLLPFARTKEALWPSTLPPSPAGQVRLWNTAFPWQPRYAQVGKHAYRPRDIGLWYVANSGDAPLVELARADLAHQRTGRIYWAKDFAAPDGLAYDVPAFTRWFDSILRWCRKHGSRSPHCWDAEALCFPSALERLASGATGGRRPR